MLQRLFQTLSSHPDLDCCSFDGTIVSVHQRATGAKGGLGISPLADPARVTTKTVALVDGLGALTGFPLLSGQTHHSKGVIPWITSVPFGALLAGKAFDTDWLLTVLDARGAATGIPPASRKHRRAYAKEACKWRPLMENFFARTKEDRGSATRYDKTDSNHAAHYNLVAALPASR